MNSLLVIALLGFMCNSAYSLTCKDCTHMTMETKPKDEGEKRSNALGMWKVECLNADGGDAAPGCDDSDVEGMIPYCYSVTAEAEFTYNNNFTGDGLTDETFPVVLYKRGCVVLANTTEASYKDAAMKDLLNTITDGGTGTFDKYDGELKFCMDEDDCNNIKLDEVSASTAIGASACLLATMLTVLVVGRQA